MSISYSIYVGPYVECKVEIVPTTHLRESCTNTACANHKRIISGSAFCNRCGSPIGTVAYIKPDLAVDDWPLIEAIDERLCTAHGDTYYTWSREKGVHLWKANVSTGGRAYHMESREDFALYEITPDQIRSEVTDFEVQFAEELAIFRETYGADAVRVTWGVIQDYS